MLIDPAMLLVDLRAGADLTDKLGNVPNGALRVAEQTLAEDDENSFSKLEALLTDAELSIIEFRRAQMSNDSDGAQQHLADALQSSRNADERDHLLEARIRMEWGLLRASLGELEQAGVDLKWAVERLKALNEGHVWHSLAMLNMAAWHESVDEHLMALVIYGDFSRNGPHTVESVSLARRRAGDILVEIDDMTGALRQFWIAHHGFRQTGLLDHAFEAGLHWLDLALSSVESDSILMSEMVEKAKPRKAGEPRESISVHPEDIRVILDWVLTSPIEVTGNSRPDLAVLLEADREISHGGIESLFVQNNEHIQDEAVLSLLQS
jgi:hypothetical protein